MNGISKELTESRKKQVVKQRLGLKSKLLLTVISIISTVSILSVGIYASSNTFAVNLDNAIEVEIRNVSGSVVVKRTGGVLAEYDQYGNVIKATSNAIPSPDYEAVLYDIDKGGVSQELERFNNTKVNLSRDYNELIYVFKYVAYTGVARLSITSNIGGSDAYRLNVVQKYYFSTEEPDWQTRGYNINRAAVLTVNADVSKILYLFAKVSINASGQSYSIQDLRWSIDIEVEPAT